MFPAWPCGWSVDAKLAAPGNATVQVRYAAGKLVSLVVEPPERASKVSFLNCVSGPV